MTTPNIFEAVCEFLPSFRTQVARVVALLASGQFEKIEALAVSSGYDVLSLKEEIDLYPVQFSQELLFTQFSVSIDGGPRFDDNARTSQTDDGTLKCCVDVVTDGCQNVRFVDADCFLADVKGHPTDLSLRVRLMGLDATKKFERLFVEVM